MDNRGWRAIHEASHGNYVDCLTYLLQQGIITIYALVGILVITIINNTGLEINLLKHWPRRPPPLQIWWSSAISGGPVRIFKIEYE